MVASLRRRLRIALLIGRRRREGKVAPKLAEVGLPYDSYSASPLVEESLIVILTLLKAIYHGRNVFSGRPFAVFIVVIDQKKYTVNLTASLHMRHFLFARKILLKQASLAMLHAKFTSPMMNAWIMISQ